MPGFTALNHQPAMAQPQAASVKSKRSTDIMREVALRVNKRKEQAAAIYAAQLKQKRSAAASVRGIPPSAPSAFPFTVEASPKLPDRRTSATASPLADGNMPTAETNETPTGPAATSRASSPSFHAGVGPVASTGSASRRGTSSPDPIAQWNPREQPLPRKSSSPAQGQHSAATNSDASVNQAGAEPTVEREESTGADDSDRSLTMGQQKRKLKRVDKNVSDETPTSLTKKPRLGGPLVFSNRSRDQSIRSRPQQTATASSEHGNKQQTPLRQTERDADGIRGTKASSASAVSSSKPTSAASTMATARRASIVNADSDALVPPTAPGIEMPVSPSSRRTSINTNPLGGQLVPPKWYTKLKPDRVAGAGDEEAKLRLRTLADNCEKYVRSKQTDTLEREFAIIANALHEAAFIKHPKIRQLLRVTRLLYNDGLPRFFADEYSGGVDYPYYIKSDAKELYLKWCDEDFDISIFRGIDRGTKKMTDRRGNVVQDFAADKLKQGYSKRKHGDYFGEGDLVNGQWWATQLATVRDGAHRSTQGGIAGRLPVKGTDEPSGAWSCIIAGNPQYPDIDNGDVVLYCGMDGAGTAPTDYTRIMLESAKPDNHNPVRVIRSFQCKEEKYRPVVGYRYDGLYDVVDQELLDGSKARYRFKLVRRPGQDPIRCEGPGARPTLQEQAAYAREK